MWEGVFSETVVSLFRDGSNFFGIITFLVFVWMIGDFYTKGKREKANNKVLDKMTDSIMEMSKSHNETSDKLSNRLLEHSKYMSELTQAIKETSSVDTERDKKVSDAHASFENNLSQLITAVHAQTNKVTEMHNFCMGRQGD